ncbi:hypothetical protein B4U79_00500 [Dinothrombium tinctorium]|uniref:Kinase n=1 Tax=Dinothrombium tinctorium TaxID=1965070 RepID=A0A3S3P8T8_9ACAR|nr:hypothetical protein B4U79_09211 [Dinothrombium tinctorium]RWS17455.1 hypothetical protein B4U79_00500 [Dinothrombium tinctorium]
MLKKCGYEQYQQSVRLSVSSTKPEFEEASSDDLSSDWDTEEIEESNKTKQSAWKKVRHAVRWSPFVQTYKKKKYPWIQLAGHQGNFRPGGQGTVLKRSNGLEEVNLKEIANDPLSRFVPKFKGKTIGKDNDESYLHLEDLLASFTLPNVMDLKMGLRTYLEEELAKAREKPKLRKDMYEKMVLIDPDEPSDEENQLKAVTKPRYMIWRETISSTATLGFRIEGIKYADEATSKDFKTVKSENQILAAFSKFTGKRKHIINSYLDRLKDLKTTLKTSPFFKNHELIGSSLLFVHDSHKANVWMIDFAKTYKLPENIKITHESPWQFGNHEDGYLIGLNNIIMLFEKIESHVD